MSSPPTFLFGLATGAFIGFVGVAMAHGGSGPLSSDERLVLLTLASLAYGSPVLGGFLHFRRERAG